MSLFLDHGGAGGYLLLLVLTFTAHAVLVGFVLGAAAWATVRALRGGDDAVAATSRDWLPFALGAAITAGVAPLLLVQVLYQHRVYTATLLLSHRFMAIVPALIVGFYLLYLAKTARVAAWPRLRRGAVTGVALALFVFVAWTWVEEHTLAQASPDQWAAHYRDERVVYGDEAIAPRLLMWLGLAATSFAAGASWLARAAAPADLRRLGITGTLGLGVALTGVAIVASGDARALPDGATLWLVLGALAVVVAVLGFGSLWSGRVRSGRWLATAGVATLYLAIAALREVRRAHTIDWRPTLDGAQGLPLFLVFAAGGTVAIVWCARLVTRNLR
ncbi:MAG TPA: hypothetical protein VM261_24055 [Kofleriaceae bacterium]|nr:hypothetical protein [Kofleriaceae bacterium]